MKFYQIKDRLSPKEIKDYIEKFESEVLPDMVDREAYYEGNNPFILERKTEVSGDAPDWKLRVSYARKIINTVVGYMYKPGNIKYNYSKEQYRKSIDEIFTRNGEDVKSSEVGKFTSIHGFGYELFMADDDGNAIWINPDPKQIIPFYTDELNPKLFCFIRYIRTKEDSYEGTIIDVYYNDVIKHYNIEKNEVIELQDDTPNIYSNYGVPLNIIKNNNEMIGDFQCIIRKNGDGGLVDAYDVMCSDGMNEEDRFAWAYLLMSDGLATQDLNKLKTNRIFESLEKDGFVKFLTKDIPTDFFKMMLDKIKNEIHQQTHVPNFLDMTIGQAASGVAIDRLLYDFEFLCAEKEAYFKQGLLERIKILDAINNVTDSEFVSQDIEVIMERNKPSDKKTNAEIAKLWKESGLPITDRKITETFATFIKDVDEEIKEYKKQEEEEEEKNINNELMNYGGINGEKYNDPAAIEQIQEPAG